MAGCHEMLFPVLPFLLSLVYSPSTSLAAVLPEDSHRGALIRRHPADQDAEAINVNSAQAHTDAARRARMSRVAKPRRASLIEKSDDTHDQWRGKRLRDRKGWSGNANMPTYCDVNYTYGTQNTDTCPYGIHINDPDDCKHAAKNLGLSHHNDESFTISPSWQPQDQTIFANGPPYPNDCFKAIDDRVYYNPSQSNSSNRSNAIPICERELYPKADANTSASTRCDDIAGPDGRRDTSGDWETIAVSAQGYQDCVRAFNCTLGMDGCRDMHMYWETNWQVNDAPPGCYREIGGSNDGCFNYNWKPDPTGPVVGFPVCKLKNR